MFDNLFSADSVQLAWEVIQAEIPFAIWETFYVTVVSTALAVVIGLPLGVLLVVGDKNGAPTRTPPRCSPSAATPGWRRPPMIPLMAE